MKWKNFTYANIQKIFRLKPAQIIILSFLIMILIGTFLLMLPFSTANNQGLQFIDALFVSTSASCVAGLTVVDVHNDLTFFGQIVMLILIQIGGLGMMTLATLIVHMRGYRFQLNESLVLQESLNQNTQAGIFELIRCIIKYTFVIEGFFAVILAIHFYKEFGINAVGYGIFHSVSIFCNAGFDLFGNYESLCKRSDDYFLMVCLAALVILGGIGFTVIADFVNRRSWKKFSLHTKIVTVVNIVMIVVGTILIFAAEKYNENTIGNLELGDQLAQSCFTSIACRTAGLNTFDLEQAEQLTKLNMIILMFIGASPLSTGGGIKTTTIFIILMSMWAVFRGRNEIVIFGRRITRELRDQALAIFTMGTIWVITAAIILSALDGERHDLEDVLFETVSGFSTVGMGIGITPDWDIGGKLILSLTMLVGRVGIMTFMVSFIAQKNTIIKYPAENIMLG